MTIRDYIRENPKPAGIRNIDYFRLVAEKMGVHWMSVERPYYQERRDPYVPEPEPEPIITEDYEKNDARILVFDIETAPLKAYVWGKWGQNIQDSFIIRDWFMLTWSAKWLFDDKVFSERLTSQEVLQEDDRRISISIWKLLDQANVIIAHNGVKFDIKRLNTRFLKHRLNHPSPYQVIDTLKHARKEFAITSNRLDYIAQFLGIPGKMETSKGLWQRCSEGDDSALAEMESYNIQDVKLLEEVYLTLRPYMRSHPNVGLYITDVLEVCASCGSNKLNPCGEYATRVNLYRAFRCRNCGSINRQRHGGLAVNERRHLTSSI